MRTTTNNNNHYQPGRLLVYHNTTTINSCGSSSVPEKEKKEECFRRDGWMCVLVHGVFAVYGLLQVVLLSCFRSVVVPVVA